MELNWKGKTVTKLEREVSPNDSLGGGGGWNSSRGDEGDAKGPCE